MNGIFTFLVSSLFFFSSLSLGKELPPQCENFLSKMRAESQLLEEIQEAFQAATELERKKDIPRAKQVRLSLAKLVAKHNGLEWPEIKDEEAKELIWEAHSLEEERTPGYKGSREYFAKYLNKIKETFGPLLSKELIRRGVLGDEKAHLQAIAIHPGEDLPKRVLAEWLEENSRPNSAALILLKIEISKIPRNEIAKINLLRSKVSELKDKALEEWNTRSESGYLLRNFGKFVSLTEEGLPVFRPNNKKDFLDGRKFKPELQKLVFALDLSHQDWNSTEAKKLAGLQLKNCTSLDFSQNNIGNAGTIAIVNSKVLGNLRSVDLRDNGIGIEGANALLKSNVIEKVVPLCFYEKKEVEEMVRAFTAYPHLLFSTLLITPQPVRDEVRHLIRPPLFHPTPQEEEDIRHFYLDLHR